MGWGITVATLVGVSAATILAATGAVAWSHRDDRAAVPFILLVANLGAWSLLYGIQLGFGTVEAQLVLQRLVVGTAGIVPTTWLFFTVHYGGWGSWLTRRRVALLLVEPVAFLALCLTNGSHHLVWAEPTATTVLDSTVPVLAFGPVYALHIAYAYTFVALGIGLLVYLGLHVSPVYRKQVATLVCGAVPALLTHVAFTLGVSPVPNLDLTPFVFSFTGIVFVLALYRFHLLDLAPIARRKSFREMGDGLLVVDADGRVADVIGVAATVLDPTPQIGMRASECLPGDSLADTDGMSVPGGVADQRRIYQFKASHLEAPQGDQTGAMVLIRDVTDLRESEQRLEVANRVLRHNLRNEMNIILGYAEQLEKRLEGEDAADARQIRAAAEALLELGEKARQMSHLGELDDSLATSLDVVDELEEIIAEFRAEHPTVTIEVDAPERAPVRLGARAPFVIAIQNVLENAAEHNDADEPRITVRVRTVGDDVRVTVSDNGEGIPEMEREVLESGTESQMLHSQGLGLWLTYWCVTVSNGTLTIETDQVGTTVAMDFPAGPEAAGAA